MQRVAEPYPAPSRRGDPSTSSGKRVILIRHAESLYNAWRTKSFRNGSFLIVCDPMIFDPQLSKKGENQAARLRQELHRSGIHAEIDLIVTSPLSRAIQTCVKGFALDSDTPLTNCPVVACALHRERLDTSGDVGVPLEQLRESAPSCIDFEDDSLDGDWWEGGGGRWDAVSQEVHKENWCHAHARVLAFRSWLLQRPEPCIAVVGHSAFFKVFMGASHKLRNCEFCEVVVLSEHDVCQVGSSRGKRL